MKIHKKKQIERNYDCIICFDLCKKPISCVRCHQLLCNHHVKLLQNRCPHCRLQPFQFQPQPLIDSYIQIQIRKNREKLKKESVFKCLVQGCQFSGKYSAMVFHRKSRHPDQKIDQILFPQQRNKKKMRQAIKKIFLLKYFQIAKKYKEQALVIYIKLRGAVDIGHIIKMLTHIDECLNQTCKEVIIGEKILAIGIKNQNHYTQCNCIQGKKFRLNL